MATEIKGLVLRIATRLDDIDQRLGEAESKLKGAGTRMQSAASGLESAFKRAFAVGAVVAFGKQIVNSAIEFESAFAGVRKTVDATDAQLGVLEQGIRDMAKELPASAVEIAGVAEAAGQLGIKTESILGFSRVMIDLGETTNLSANEAATALARLANITGLPQDQFDRLGSAVVDLGNNLATTEAEIVTMGLRLAGAGEQVGLTEAQILGMAGALSSVGIEAEAGGSAFSKVMINIANAAATGSDDLATFAAVAGMSAADFKQAFETDAAGAFASFVEGLKRIESEGGNTLVALEELGIKEVRMRDALLRTSNAGDLLRKSMELGTEAFRENTALTKEAEQRYNTTAAQLEKFKNKVTDLGIELGSALLPALNKSADAAGEFFDVLSGESSGATTALSRVTDGAAAVVVQTLEMDSALIKTVGALSDAVTWLRNLEQGSDGVLQAMNPLGDLLGKMPGLFDVLKNSAIGVLSGGLIPLIDGLGWVGEKLGFFSEKVELSAKAEKNLSDFTKGLVTDLKATTVAVQDAGPHFSELDSVFTKGTESGKNLGAEVKKTAEELKAEAEAAKKAKEETEKLAKDALKEAREEAEKFKDALSDLSTELELGVITAVGFLDGKTKALADRLLYLSRAGQESGEEFQQLRSQLQAAQAAMEAGTAAAADFEGQIDGLDKELDKLLNKDFKAWLDDLSLEYDLDIKVDAAKAFDGFEQAVYDVINGINDAFEEDAFSGFADALYTQLDGVAGAAQNFFAQSGPWGQAIAIGMGVLQTFGLDIEGLFDGLFEGIGKGLARLFGGSPDRINPQKNIVTEALDRLAEGMRTITAEAEVLGPGFDAAGAQIGLLEDVMIDMLAGGVYPTDQAFVRLQKRLNDLRVAADNAFSSDGDGLSFDPADFLDLDAWNAAKAELDQVGQSIKDMVEQGLRPGDAAFDAATRRAAELNEEIRQLEEDARNAAAAMHGASIAEITDSFASDFEAAAERARLTAESLGEEFDASAFATEYWKDAITDWIAAGNGAGEVLDWLIDQYNSGSRAARDFNDDFVHWTDGLNEAADNLPDLNTGGLFADLNVIREALDRSLAGISQNAMVAALLGQDYNEAAQRAKAYEEAIRALIDKGYDPQSDAVQDLIKQFEAASAEADAYTNALRGIREEMAEIAQSDVERTMEELADAIAHVEVEFGFFGNAIRSTEDKIRLVKKAMEELADQGTPDALEAFRLLEDQLAALEEQLLALEESAAGATDAVNEQNDANDGAGSGGGSSGGGGSTTIEGDLNIDFPNNLTVQVSGGEIRALIDSIQWNTFRNMAADVERIYNVLLDANGGLGGGGGNPPPTGGGGSGGGGSTTIINQLDGNTISQITYYGHQDIVTLQQGPVL